MQAKDLNRLKLVLVEKRELVFGWQNNWECQIRPSLSGVATHLSQHFLHWIK